MTTAANEYWFSLQEPYFVNLLMGGYNPATSKTELHYMDYLAASVPVSYYAFGYGGMFTLSIMDQEYRSGNYHHSLDLH